MKIKNAEYILTAVNEKQYPTDHLKEIILAGRSNVGKSSFINSIANNNKLARVSSTPGKTATLNFYLINKEFYFVDAPGYGYAKRSKEEIEKFGLMFEKYLTERKNLVLAILLVDFRHEPTMDDVIMYQGFKQLNLPVLIILTKADKVKNSEKNINKKLIKDKLNISGDDMIEYSITTKINHDTILNTIEKYL